LEETSLFSVFFKHIKLSFSENAQIKAFIDLPRIVQVAEFSYLDCTACSYCSMGLSWSSRALVAAALQMN